MYIACPPLYSVSSGARGKPTYAYSEDEKDLLYEKTTNPSVQRFKGLGEMMPTQLWDTTMDPSTRTLRLVTIDDAASADKMLSLLMGDVVAPRKEFIIAGAQGLADSDLDF